MTHDATSTRAVWLELSERLRRFIRARVADEETASDLLQETFLRIHQRLDTLDEQDRLAAWVFRIARNTVIDHYRAAARGPAHAEPEATSPDPDAGNRNDDVAGWLPALIDALPARYREAVRLHEIEGLAQAEVAERLGLSLSAAKSRVQRGRARLRAALDRCCTFELDRRGNVLDYERRPAGPCCDVCADDG